MMSQATCVRRRLARSCPLFASVLAFLLLATGLSTPAAGATIPATLSGPFTMSWSVTVRTTRTPEEFARFNEERIRAWNQEVERGKISRAQADRIIADIKREAAEGPGAIDSRPTRTDFLCLVSDGLRVEFSRRKPGDPCGVQGLAAEGSKTCIWDGKSTFCVEGRANTATVGHFFDLAGMYPLMLPGISLPSVPFIQGKPVPATEGTHRARVLYTIDRTRPTGEYLDADVSVAREKGRLVIRRASLKRQGVVVRTMEFGKYRLLGKTPVPETFTVDEFATGAGRSQPKETYEFALAKASAAVEPGQRLNADRFLFSTRDGYGIQVIDGPETLSFRYDPKMGRLESQIEQNRNQSQESARRSSTRQAVIAIVIVLALAAGAFWLSRRRRV